MSTWNVRLGRKKTIIQVKEILGKGSGFAIIRDQYGREQKLLRRNFPIDEWNGIKVGSEIALIIGELIIKAQVLLVKSPIDKVWENIPIPGCLWCCDSCEKRGVRGYETGDDLSVVIRHILEDHKKASSGCECSITDLHIYDHNFVEQKGLQEILALQKAQ